ncbi:MAG: hypothetical protein ACI8P0_005024 [Planctomycetaceae bacterium]|jgi:hypothetical protein
MIATIRPDPDFGHGPERDAAGKAQLLKLLHTSAAAAKKIAFAA